MVAQGNLRCTQFARDAIKHAAPQPRAQATHGGALGHDALHHRVCVLYLDAEFHAQRTQVLGQHVLGVTGVPLVEVHGDQREVHRRSPLQFGQIVLRSSPLHAAQYGIGSPIRERI